jgi:hypothetical protein
MATSAFRKFTGTVQADAFVTKFGKNVGVRVINNSGTDIARDKLVVITGYDTTNNLPQIVLANGTTTGHDDIYVTLSTIKTGTVKGGYVYKGGLSAATLDTSSASAAGDAVYLSDSAAGGVVLTTAPTTANSRIRPVGFVRVKSATVGQIRWAINPASQQEPTAGFFVASVAAAGTNQATAGAITAPAPAIVTVTAANTNNGVALPAATAGKMVVIQNAVTNQSMSVYSNPGGDVINALSSTAGFVLAGAKTGIFSCAVTGTWFTVLTA